MSRLSDARAELVTALRAGGVRTATSGRFSAPVVILEPADPWTEPARLPGRNTRWQLIAIAGAGDSDAAIDELAELIDRVDAVLRRVDGCGLPSWGKPTDRPAGDVALPSTIGTFTLALR